MGKHCMRTALANGGTIATIGLGAALLLLPSLILYVLVPALNLLGDIFGR